MSNPRRTFAAFLRSCGFVDTTQREMPKGTSWQTCDHCSGQGQIAVQSA